MTVLMDKHRFPHLAFSVLVVGLIAIVAVLFLSSPILRSATTINSFEQAKTLADQYVAVVSSDLKVAEVEEWSNNFYIRVQEKSTEINAFELLIDKSTGRIAPEPGPNMMWNTKYGMMGGMMGRSIGTSTSNMSVSPSEAVGIAQSWLDTNFPSAKVNEPDTFYGHYTLDFSRDGNIVGMLSVNGYTGAVWFHSWHGAFIGMKEYS